MPKVIFTGKNHRKPLRELGLGQFFIHTGEELCITLYSEVDDNLAFYRNLTDNSFIPRSLPLSEMVEPISEDRIVIQID